MTVEADFVDMCQKINCLQIEPEEWMKELEFEQRGRNRQRAYDRSKDSCKTDELMDTAVRPIKQYDVSQLK